MPGAATKSRQMLAGQTADDPAKSARSCDCSVLAVYDAREALAEQIKSLLRDFEERFPLVEIEKIEPVRVWGNRDPKRFGVIEDLACAVKLRNDTIL